MASDGYYTRPAFMYVAEPNGNAKSGTELTNIDVVRNSYRALMMVVLENIGFAMEYLDPEKHGICPTIKSRAQKISKYAGRVSMALHDANVILVRHGYDGVRFDTDWWKEASQGRTEDDYLYTSFNLTHISDVAMTSENSENMRSPFVHACTKFFNEFETIIKSLPQVANTAGGGGDSARSWATMMFLGLLTLVASASPRPSVFR
jgi:hypothetical protein